MIEFNTAVLEQTEVQLAIASFTFSVIQVYKHRITDPEKRKLWLPILSSIIFFVSGLIVAIVPPSVIPWLILSIGGTMVSGAKSGTDEVVKKIGTKNETSSDIEPPVDYNK